LQSNSFQDYINNNNKCHHPPTAIPSGTVKTHVVVEQVSSNRPLLAGVHAASWIPRFSRMLLQVLLGLAVLRLVLLLL
jgi:hypothetical protein